MPNKMPDKLITENVDPYDSLIGYLAKTTEAAQIKAILTALLTDKEQLDIANRIRIFDLLSQGITQREVSKHLGVGIATVSRGAKAFQQHDVSDLLTSLETETKKQILNESL